MTTMVFDNSFTARVTPLRARAVPTSPAAPTRVAYNRAAPKLHITKRGRAVLMALIVVPVVVGAFLIAINGGGAAANLAGSTVPFTYLTVEPGESLWKIAQTVAPASDPRDVIDAIVALNALQSADIFAGQRVAIPQQYQQR